MPRLALDLHDKARGGRSGGERKGPSETDNTGYHFNVSSAQHLRSIATANTQFASRQFGEVSKMASVVFLCHDTYGSSKQVETDRDREKENERGREKEREKERERVKETERETEKGDREGGPIEGTHVSHLAAAATCSRASVVVPASPAPTTTMMTGKGYDGATRNTPLVAAAVTVAATAVAHVGRCARRIAPATTARSSRLAHYSRASVSRGLARSSPACRG